MFEQSYSLINRSEYTEWELTQLRDIESTVRVIVLRLSLAYK